MATLVLLRHGDSAWNASDRFTGWVDVPLTARGEVQARESGALLRANGLVPTVLHTSVLDRAVQTGALAAEAAGVAGVPRTASWRLNERCYGALQGRTRAEVLAEHGPELFHAWRRSLDAAPPPLPPGGTGDASGDLRYAGVPGGVPRTESLVDVLTRLRPHWTEVIAPDLRAGHTVLVVGHSNSLRALIAHLDRLTAEEVPGVEIPTGALLRYEFHGDSHGDLRPVVRGGCRLTRAAQPPVVPSR